MDGLSGWLAEVDPRFVGQARVLGPVAGVVTHDQGQVVAGVHAVAQHGFDLARQGLTHRYRGGGVRLRLPVTGEQHGLEVLPAALGQEALRSLVVVGAEQAVKSWVAGDHHTVGWKSAGDQPLAHALGDHAGPGRFRLVQHVGVAVQAEQVHHADGGQAALTGHVQRGAFAAGRVGGDHRVGLQGVHHRAHEVQGPEAVTASFAVKIRSARLAVLSDQIQVVDAQVGDGLVARHVRAGVAFAQAFAPGASRVGINQVQEVPVTQRVRTRRLSFEVPGGQGQ